MVRGEDKHFRLRKALKDAKYFELYPKRLEKCLHPYVWWHQVLGPVVFFLSPRTQVGSKGREYNVFQAGVFEDMWNGRQQRQRSKRPDKSH